MPHQEKVTLPRGGNVRRFFPPLPYLLPSALRCGWEEDDQFLVLPWDGKERVGLVCDVLDCLGDTWRSGFCLTLLGAETGMLASFGYQLGGFWKQQWTLWCLRAAGRLQNRGCLRQEIMGRGRQQNIEGREKRQR